MECEWGVGDQASATTVLLRTARFCSDGSWFSITVFVYGNSRASPFRRAFDLARHGTLNHQLW